MKNKSRLLVLLVLLPVILFATSLTLSYLSKAATANIARVYFQPTTTSLPGNKLIKIMTESLNGDIAFASVAFTFDNTKVKLTSEISINPLMSTVVQKTTMADANAQGYVRIVVAVPPQSTYPTGIFEFAGFSIDSVTSVFDQSAINFDTSKLQVVNAGGLELTPDITNLTLQSIYPTVTPYSAPSTFQLPSATPFIPSVTPYIPSPTRLPTPTYSPNSVGIYFGPNPVNVPPQSQVHLMLDSGNNKTAMVRLTMNFDISKVRLVNEINVNPVFTNVITKTSMADANTTGEIVLILTMDTTLNMPSGKFEAVNFTIDGLKNGIKSSLDIDPLSVLVMNSDSVELSPIITNLGINRIGDIVGYISPTPRAHGRKCKSPTDPRCLKTFATEYINSLSTSL